MLKKKQCIKDLLEPNNHSPDQSKSLFDRIEENFCSHPHCPYCESKAVRKWGRQVNKQRFQCKVCKRTFISLTKTELADAHYIDVLDQYLAVSQSLAQWKLVAVVSG